MEVLKIIIAILTSIFTINIVLGMLGGCLGVLVAREREQMRTLSLLLYMCVGAGLAAAAIEKLAVATPWISFFVGFVAGVLSGDAVPALKAASPSLYKKLEKLFNLKK